MPAREWSPTSQVAKLDRDFDDIFDHFMSHDWCEAKPNSMPHHHPALESFIDSDRLVVRADLPGVDPKDVEIIIDKNVLTIRGLRVCTSDEERRDLVHREIKYGNFERAISIPNGVKKEDINAAWRNGVLELTVPFGDAAKVRKVPVQKLSRAKEPERRQ